VGFEGEGHAELGGDVAEAVEVVYGATVSGFVGRLAGAGDGDGGAEPAAGAAQSALGDLEALGGEQVGASDVDAGEADAVVGEVVGEARGGGVVGRFGEHGMLGDDEAAEVVGAEGEFDVV
jgi:hypothetical protein